MKSSLLFLILAGFFAAESEALTVTEDFTSRAHYGSGTAVWNQELGVLSPSLQVMNYKVGFGAGDEIAVDIGDGSDGPFKDSTYANFSVGGDLSGHIIRVDTSRPLNVTNFTLNQGWTIEPVGNNPLIIKSLSYVHILGEIHCSGEDGGDASGASGGTGGSGRCGGLSGGDGGSATSAGQPGGDAGTIATGGRGGNYVGGGSFVGGGGGGSWSTITNPTDGANASASGGKAGGQDADPEFIQVAGGPGGGGGSGDGTNAGGGGGGGGGVVLIYAAGDLDLGQSGQAASSTLGIINVNGGNGGASPGGAGPGGGGAGGSVQVFVGGGINFYNPEPSGASQAAGGAGGGSVGVGTGGLGRSWFSSLNGNSGSGSYSPSEEFPVNSGDVEYSPNSETIVTNSYDLLNSFATIGSLQISPASTDFVLQVSGSSDDFASDDTGWTTNPSRVANKRYLRFRITITTDIFSPTLVDSISVTFTPGSPDQFSFRTAGCGRVGDGGGSRTLNLLLMLMAPLILIGLKIETQRQVARK